MAKKLKNSLKDNLKAKIEPDEEGSLGFGIDIDIGGVGITLTTENGGTVGIGVGIIGIEYNALGGGKVDYLNGLYKMEVEKVGCSYVKDFYVGGIYTHTETQKVPNCDEEEDTRIDITEEAEKDITEDDGEEGLISSSSLGENEYIEKIIVRYKTNIYEPGSVYSIAPGGDGYIYNPRKPAKTTTGEYEAFVGSAPYGFPVKYGYFALNSYYSYTILRFTRFEEIVSFSTSGIVPVIYNENKNFYLDTGKVSRTAVFQASPTGWGIFSTEAVEEVASYYLETKSRFGRDALRGYVSGEEELPDGRVLHKFAIVNTSFSFEWVIKDAQKKRRNDYRPPVIKKNIPDKNRMNNEKCCFSEDDRSLMILNARALGALNFPGIIQIKESEKGKTIDAQFPATGETENLISNYIQLKLKLLELNPQGIQQTDNELLEKVALNLGIPIPEKSPESVYLPEGITKENNVYGFPFKIPRNWLQPEAKGEMTIHNQPQLSLITTAMISSGSSDKLDKIASLLGIPEKGEVLNPKGEETYQKDSDTGFPIEIPDYLNQPKKKDGLYEKDLKKYPKIKLNNLRELELYRLQMFQELYRFSGALSTVREGFEMGVDLWIPNASENEKEYPHELTGILARMVSIIDAHGLPLSLTYNIKGTDGDIPAEPLNTKAYIEILGDTVQHLYQKSVRNQITLSKLALLGTSLHKILIVIYRLIKVSIKGIGIPIRDTIKEEAEKTGQDTEIETQFDATGFIRGGFSPSTGDKNELSKSFTPDDEDIDKIQDDINKPGIINSKGFDLKNRTIPLWLKLFRQ